MLTLKKVAVTGGLASGKSAVCHILEEYGACVVNADSLVHQLLSTDASVIEKVVKKLGPEVISDYQIDRSKVAKQVFSHKEKLQELENILHPAVFHAIHDLYKAASATNKYSSFVVEIPLLYETKNESWFDIVVVVMADKEICIRRAIERGSTLEEYNARMARQLSPEEKAQKADVVIYNNGTYEILKEQVSKFLSTL